MDETFKPINNRVTLDDMLLRGARHDLLNHYLQAKQVPYSIHIMRYDDALESVPDLSAQLLNLERQFPPGIAFLDGFDKQTLGDLELIRDLTSPDALVTVGVLVYSSDVVETLAKQILGESVETVRFAAGYALANKLHDREFNEIGIYNYVNSVLTHHNFRQVTKLGEQMMAPILTELDKEGDSFLTTWVNNGAGSRPLFSHYSAAGFWHRQGYMPIQVEKARETRIVDALVKFHKSHGVTGRNYTLQPRKVEDLERDLNPLYETGGKARRIFSGLTPSKEVAILSEYYEPTGYKAPRWDGIIMVRSKDKDKWQ